MLQIGQKLKDGRLDILDMPVPPCRRHEVLVRTCYSCISIGTESGKVKAARKGYLGKARERPEQAKQVLEKLLTQGPVQTYRDVMKKLEAYSPLGYSCSGRVIAVSPDVREFSVGDLVACGGSAACHSEVVAVNANLCVRLEPDADLKQAAYNSLGSIALQGVRQADLRLGETCAVIGLGVLGQLTCALLRAAGVRVVGVDINPALVELASKQCADAAFTRDQPGIENRIVDFADGMGCDAVIITAGSDSLDPINFAGSIARKRGTIVVVGAVPTGFSREPHYYNKELSIRMSCSYGPGRYDPAFEEKGAVYPYAYVRWTEKRNMQAFQELIASRRISIGYLTTHVFRFEEAVRAYEMMLERKEPFLGILLEYDPAREIRQEAIRTGPPAAARAAAAAVSIGFIGAGSYAQGFLLPNLQKTGRARLKGVMTGTPSGGRSVAERFGFEFCTGNPDDILADPQIDTVFIATRHSTHARYVLAALEAGKNVFVEKPLCLSLDELEQIRERVGRPGERRVLMVGYNRRFSPLGQTMKRSFSAAPLSLVYRVNAGAVAADSWIQDPDIGGGRVIGEVCHFVDYAIFMTGSLPDSVQAISLPDPNHLDDTLSVSLGFRNGSIAAIHYFANGSRLLSKEYIEVYQEGVTAVLDDFRLLTLFEEKSRRRVKLITRDKGQRNEIEHFLSCILDGTAPALPFEEIYASSLATFRILESLQTRQALGF